MSNKEQQMNLYELGFQGDHIAKKISNFLEMKNLLISDFWKSDRNYASPDDLQSFCDQCGFKLGINDQINLKAELFSDREVISIYQFCDLIPHWKENCQEMIGEFLKQRSELLVKKLNSKNKQSQRFKSSSNHYSRSQIAHSNDNKSKTRLFSATHKDIKPFRPNNSKKYLEQHNMRSLKKEKELAKTIEKTKNQYEYGMLLKMNEMNEFSRKNKSSITYRAFKNAEGLIKVRVFDLENLKKEMTIKEFQSEYKIFKKSTKENKEWERPAAFKPSQNESFSRAGSNLQKNMKKEQRQEELRNLLVNTVNLTKLLQEQIKIFKMRGIYGCEGL